MPPTPARRYDLDWLRVLAILGVFVFHSTRFFNDRSWHVFNRQASPIATVFVLLFSQWGMPFIFVVSGASLYYALRPGQATRFVGERGLRLLVPLALGILVLGPPQIYLERLTHGQFYGSFWKFLPHYFDGWYGFGLGNFAWQGVHLWYLLLLFVFSVLLLPVFAALKTPAGQRWTAALGRAARVPGVIWLWVLPIVVVMSVLDPDGLGARSFGGWGLFTYPWFLLFGFLVYASDDIQAVIVRQRWVALLAAVGLSVALVELAPGLTSRDFGTPRYAALMAIDALYAWSWIQLFLGFGMKHLQRGHRLLPVANEAVLPFYVLHQPVLLFVGYFVVRWPLPILAKWLIITPIALVLIVGLYEFGIRRFNVTRALLGLKRLPTARPAVAVPPLALPEKP
jgi:peptidoglycan/LPS O-acetylase OafA/YrhL